MHLARLRSDFNYMNGQILVLKEKINNIMLKKFGTVIDLDEMEENILKRFLLNFEGSAETIDKEHKKKSDELKVCFFTKISQFHLNVNLFVSLENHYGKRN